jgi:hypothetical protein
MGEFIVGQGPFNHILHKAKALGCDRRLERDLERVVDYANRYQLAVERGDLPSPEAGPSSAAAQLVSLRSARRKA